MSALALQLEEQLPPLERLRATVRADAPKTPGVYVFADPHGRVVYVGKAKNLRQRLLSYFTAPYPESKSAQLIRCATHIRWRPLPTEFAALIEEQRLIKSLRPAYNVVGTETRAATLFIKLTGGPAPKLALTDEPRDAKAMYYGPFRGRGMTGEAVRALTDLLKLRDCNQALPMYFADQASLFEAPKQQPVRSAASGARCMRYDLGTCLGPCAGLVTADRYEEATRRAADFLEGRSAHPLDVVLDQMADATKAREFERAAHWKEKFEALEWFFGAVSRLRAAIEGLSFVYQVKDASGGKDDRVYLVKHGVVRAEAPWPRTPLEKQAFAQQVEQLALNPEPAPAARTAREMDQLLLVMSWFRQHPQEYEHATSFAKWADAAH